MKCFLFSQYISKCWVHLLVHIPYSITFSIQCKMFKLCVNRKRCLYMGVAKKPYTENHKKATHVQNMCINFDQSKNEICYSIKFSIEIYINVF